MNATLPGAFLRDFSRVLTCFSKVNDEVTLEAQPGKLLISAINSAKSSFMLATLNASVFDKFEYVAPPADAQPGRQRDRQLYCSIQTRALLSIFRPRNVDNRPDAKRDNTVERCELKMLHPSDERTQCAFLVRLLCKHGVRKTFKLQYEPVRSEHATCDRFALFNRLKISAASLKEVVDHFALRAEEVTLGMVDGNLQITSFTEGMVAKGDSRQVLKQPVSTTVMMDATELDEADADEDVRITFGIREFKACCTLSEQLGVQLKLSFETPGRPLLVEFEHAGMSFELIVATTNDAPAASATAKAGRAGTARPPATLMGRKRPLTGAASSNRRLQAGNHSSPTDVGFSSTSGVGRHQGWSSQGGGGDFASGTMAAPSTTPVHRSGGHASQPLFLPDDEPTQRSSAGAQSRTLAPVPDPPVEEQDDFGFAQSDDDALELYADELNEDEGDVMSATQHATQPIPRPRGLFE